MIPYRSIKTAAPYLLLEDPFGQQLYEVLIRYPDELTADKLVMLSETGGGYGVSYTAADITHLCGYPFVRVYRILPRWVRHGYLRREGTGGNRVYRLLPNCREWKHRADRELPRAAEIVAEVLAYQQAMGLDR